MNDRHPDSSGYRIRLTDLFMICKAKLYEPDSVYADDRKRGEDKWQTAKVSSLVHTFLTI